MSWGSRAGFLDGLKKRVLQNRQASRASPLAKNPIYAKDDFTHQVFKNSPQLDAISPEAQAFSLKLGSANIWAHKTP